MEHRSPFDIVWSIQFLAAAKRLVALAVWQNFNWDDEITAFVKAIDTAQLTIRPKPARTLPITRHAQRAFSYGLGVYGETLARQLRPKLHHLHWQHNGNYVDEPTAADYLAGSGYAELIGPDGMAVCNTLRIGCLLMRPNVHYPFHHHPAGEIYYVLSGQGYFKPQGKPWRSSPANQYILHTPNQPHAIETRDSHLLAIYIWRGDVQTAATLTRNLEHA